jgi:hypothetical protein
MLARQNRELWLSFIAVILITLLYLFVTGMLNGVPPASDFFGHSIGIVGFILMLMTESLYSLRKRSRGARWGKMSNWLDFHIFTGLVGPYLVLLHTSWKFNGLAGIVMLLTVIIVASGFVGRYIYTAVPRTADGIELEAGSLNRQIAQADTQLQEMLANSPEKMQLLAKRFSSQPAEAENQTALIFGRVFSDWRYRQEWRRAKRGLDAGSRAQINQLEKMIERRRTLRRQINTLVSARRMMALWHTVHIPIGMVLFTAAFIHIIAAIYYATLLR